MKEIEGNLIELAKQGEFQFIGHGANCFCVMGGGIAVPMREEFKVNEYPLEQKQYAGDINKLGQIQYQFNHEYGLYVANMYTQYDYRRKPGVINLDYQALELTLMKVNHAFKGKSVGLPLIGCGLAGGDWATVKMLMEKKLKDVDLTIVHFKD